MSVIVNIRLETDLNEFTSTVTDGGDLYWAEDATAKAVAGTQGALAVLIDDTTAIYGSKTGLNDSSNIWSSRFHIDPNTITFSATTGFYTYRMEYGTTQFAGCKLRYSTGVGYRIVGFIYDDLGTETETPIIAITDAPHSVEILLTRATTNLSANGSIRIWVDGAEGTPRTGIDNYDRATKLDVVRLGVPVAPPSTVSGTFYLDELVVNNDGGLIGPYGTTYTETGGAISVLTASGADLLTFADTGQATTVLTASGVEALTLTETGQSISVLTASGADTVTFIDTGQAISVLTATGVEAETLTETGQATSILNATGIETVTITEIGNAISVLTASGVEEETLTETGQAISVLTASGADIAAYQDTGQATSILTASGAELLSFVDTGQATTILTGTGADDYIPSGGVTYTEAGEAISLLIASGSETVTITEIGSAISVLTASGDSDQETHNAISLSSLFKSMDRSINIRMEE
jgi:hypothetical protein